MSRVSKDIRLNKKIKSTSQWDPAHVSNSVMQPEDTATGQEMMLRHCWQACGCNPVHQWVKFCNWMHIYSLSQGGSTTMPKGVLRKHRNDWCLFAHSANPKRLNFIKLNQFFNSKVQRDTYMENVSEYININTKIHIHLKI